ncbi:uncharacterized protein LOC133290994 [Gastrolobium bilobum]|uniref:uncharacterized protein LOC133290994 n=1 Tax=Gastrolobium bilobum TaxID=150636 RepID=UPI002AAF3290|nr:uncharacterized protein LOC133290994 [Gastrolobium bilobum]
MTVEKNNICLDALMEARTNGSTCCKLMRKINFDKSIVEEATGFSGGIWIMWDSRRAKVEVISQATQYIHMRVEIENINRFLCTAIYASPHEVTRHEMWEEVKLISQTSNEPWIMAGDFNDIRCSDEKRGDSPTDIAKCLRFQYFLDSCQVEEVTGMGAKFTWQGPKWNHLDRVFKKLDRVCANMSWRLNFDEATVRVMPRILSDHSPLLLTMKSNMQGWSERPFRFMAAWMEHPDFERLMEDKWHSDMEINGMLSNFIPQLKRWNRDVYGNINNRKRNLVNRIVEVQRHRENGEDPGLQQLEDLLQNDLNITLEQEELMWFQKSRHDWIADGDKNTRFYHLKTVMRRCSNIVTRLRNNLNEWIEDPCELKNHVCNFYKDLFTEEVPIRRWIISDTLWPTLE